MSSWMLCTGRSARTTTASGVAVAIDTPRNACGNSYCCFFEGSSELMARLPTAPSSTVYPSGLALTTNCAPISPAAPALFSTTTGWPRILDSCSAYTRAEKSVAPPGGYGTIILMGAAGQVPADAVAQPTISRAPRMREKNDAMVVSGELSQILGRKFYYLIFYSLPYNIPGVNRNPESGRS